MKDKTPTGAATVTYENPDSAKRAIDFFDEKDFKGEVKSIPGFFLFKLTLAGKVTN